MTTTGSSASGSGHGRGRGLDALFDGNQPSASPATDIDAELAAMLDEEVRAGAPPIESLSAIPTVQEHDLLATPPMMTGRGMAAQDAYGLAGAAQPAASWGRRGVLPGLASAPAAAAEETIDMPLPVADAAPDGPAPVAPPVVPAPVAPAVEAVAPAPSASLPVTPAPVTPPAGPAPVTPAPVTPPPAEPAPVSGERPGQSPIRIGAVIIDSTPSPATPPAAETPVSVGPAGELIPVGQPGTQAVVPVLPGQRDVMPPGPGVRPAVQQLPTAQVFAEDQKTVVINRLNVNLNAEWQKSLHVRIDDLYKQVATKFSSPPANADRMLTLLTEARQILIESPENFVAIESRMMQVQVTMTRTTESRAQATRYGPRILGYEVLWLALLLLGLVFAAPLVELFTRSGAMTGATANDMFPFWNTLMWGGIGGIIGALYALWWHISDQQDFERQYLMWYLVQPIMGTVLGGIVFLLLSGGFLLLQVKPTDTNAGARLIPYLVAVLAGFRQNFIYGQFDRLIALFAPGGNQAGGNQSGGNSQNKP
jgi:hypothetical protein